MKWIDRYLPDGPWPWHKHLVVFVVLGMGGVGFTYVCYLIAWALNGQED